MHRYLKCMAVRVGICETRTDSSYWCIHLLDIDSFSFNPGNEGRHKQGIQSERLTVLLPDYVFSVRNQHFGAYSPLFLNTIMSQPNPIKTPII
jgi:hypothetical protein